MGRLHSATFFCAVLIGAMPVAAAAQANINTSRSNTKGVAAPNGDTSPDEESGQDQGAVLATAPEVSVAPVPSPSATGTTVPKQTQGATFGEKVNAGLQASGNAVVQGAAAQAAAEGCANQPARAATGTSTAPETPSATGPVKTTSDKPQECPVPTP